MVARRCQQYAQPLSPAVIRGNDSYNTNRPSASVVTIIRNHSYTCASAVFTSCGYYSKAAFIHSELWIVRLPFEGSDYLRAASIQRNTVI